MYIQLYFVCKPSPQSDFVSTQGKDYRPRIIFDNFYGGANIKPHFVKPSGCASSCINQLYPSNIALLKSQQTYVHVQAPLICSVTSVLESLS